MAKRTDDRRYNGLRRMSAAASAATMTLPALLAGAPTTPSSGWTVPEAMAHHETFSVRPASYTDAQAVDKFTDYGYTYCDAKVMASFWGESSPYEAKARLGHKMLQGVAAEPYVASARRRTAQMTDESLPCDYEDGGFSYSDMEKLAQAWGKDVWTTKLKVRRLLVGGEGSQVRRALRQAGGNSKKTY